MPGDKTINHCWQSNPDGAGIAYWRPGMQRVIIHKGFMKLKALKTVLNELMLGKDDLMLLHFRWATHGYVDSGNCHPFPLSSKPHILRTLQGEFPTAIAHNGVFGSMPCHETLSDTQKFIAKILCNPLIVAGLDNPAVKELIRGYCGTSSKLAFLKAGKMSLIGEWDKDEKTGLIYSNNDYEPYKYAHHGHTHLTDEVEEYPVVRPGGECSLEKQCELCQETANITYDDAYQLFLCDKCLALNLRRD